MSESKYLTSRYPREGVNESLLIAVLNCVRYHGHSTPEVESPEYEALLDSACQDSGRCTWDSVNEVVRKEYGIIPVVPSVPSSQACLLPFVYIHSYDEDDFPHFETVVGISESGTYTVTKDSGCQFRSGHEINLAIRENGERSHLTMYQPVSMYECVQDLSNLTEYGHVHRVGFVHVERDQRGPVSAMEAIVCISRNIPPTDHDVIKKLFLSALKAGKDRGKRIAQRDIRNALGITE